MRADRPTRRKTGTLSPSSDLQAYWACLETGSPSYAPGRCGGGAGSRRLEILDMKRKELVGGVMEEKKGRTACAVQVKAPIGLSGPYADINGQLWEDVFYRLCSDASRAMMEKTKNP